MNNKLLSKAHAAEFLGISTLKLDRLRQDGGIAFVKIGDRVLFQPEDLQDFVNRNRRGNSLDCPGNSPKSAAPEMSIRRPGNV